MVWFFSDMEITANYLKQSGFKMICAFQHRLPKGIFTVSSTCRPPMLKTCTMNTKRWGKTLYKHILSLNILSVPKIIWNVVQYTFLTPCVIALKYWVFEMNTRYKKIRTYNLKYTRRFSNKNFKASTVFYSGKTINQVYIQVHWKF